MIVINEILSEVYRQFVLQLTEHTPIFHMCFFYKLTKCKISHTIIFVVSLVNRVFLLQIATVQAFDMRPYLDLLMHLLLMGDTCQQHRLMTSLKGESTSHTTLPPLRLLEMLCIIVTCVPLRTWNGKSVFFCIFAKRIRFEISFRTHNSSLEGATKLMLLLRCPFR